MPKENQLNDMAQLTFGQHFAALSATNKIEIVNLCIQANQSTALIILASEGRKLVEHFTAPKEPGK